MYILALNMYKPLITLGLCLLVVSLVGLLGACCRVSVFQWLYLLTLFVLIVGLLACLSVGSVIIRGGEKGGDVLGGVKEYDLAMFSKWLKNNIVSSNQWQDIVNCMVHHNACGRISTFRTLIDFVTSKKSKLTSMEVFSSFLFPFIIFIGGIDCKCCGLVGDSNVG
ncbi:hypothetical protein RND81_10G207100 [Saponaria officinalis]|uniref:Uncharacterized protein n=1 Tax=Saponaria officinalis TaxID=3572 RepID=A0AAW1I489_SAPOF